MVLGFDWNLLFIMFLILLMFDWDDWYSGIVLLCDIFFLMVGFIGGEWELKGLIDDGV